jgi:hypothetical protein
MAPAFAALLLLPCACAINPLPAEQLANSRAAVARAVAANAGDVAPEDLALAREKLRLAERWIAARDYKPARWLAEQAEVDARVASMRAVTARSLRFAPARESRR